MGQWLTHQDLSCFLRSRPSANARIAADWVEDHPDHPQTQAVVDQLESLARAAGLELRSEAWAAFGETPLTWWNWCAAGLNRHHSEDSLQPVLAVLTGQPVRFQPESCELTAWTEILSGTRRFLDRFLPAWTAALVRRLRRAAAVNA